MKLRSLLVTLALLMSISSFAAVTIDKVGGWFESGYVTFGLVDGASTYAVYYKTTSGSDYLKLDSELVRNYGTYGRADVLGITAGTYQFKVVPVDGNGNEMVEQAAESASFEVKAHDRAGFAFSNGKVPGAYKSDGTLKSDAVVIYITDANKDKVTLDVITSSKGAVTSCVGFQEILNGFKKGTDKRPLAFRLIGQISDPIGDKGDIVVDMNKATTCAGITIEGVGNDAVADGWGIRLKGASSVEIRNLAVMNCDSDEGDNIGLQQDNEYVWVHNCDLFYGHAGSDKDQAKGDGVLDCKKSNYVTFSYNHFWDSGKCCLLSNGDNEYGYLITYHHNWFDHSDSRHPRVRCYSAHVYNNYFDGIAKYGVGATMGSSVFVENNYFRNVNKPMMISKQGTDAKGEGTFSGANGGVIKAYGNEFAEKSANFSYIAYQTNSTSFDAYEASSRDEKVPSSVKTLAGGTIYDNFDTDAGKMYSYAPDKAVDVPNVIKGQYGAGRMQHGDFEWAFDNSADDASYDVNQALKTKVMSYQTSLVGIFGSTGGGDNSDPAPDPDPEPNPNPNPNSGYACWFLAGNA